MVVEKHLKLTGISNVSWKDAITKAILEASKSLDYITSVQVLEQKAKIDGNKINCLINIVLLSRCSHIKQFICLKCTIQCFLLYSDMYNWNHS